MGNNKARGRGVSRNRFIVICCALALVLVVLIVAAWLITRETPTGSTPGDQLSGPMEKMVMHSVEEQGDLVYVKTTYGDFSYPYAFSDLVAMEPVNEENCVGLAFSAYIEEKSEPVYTLWINSDRGMTAGTLRVEDKTYGVTIEIMDARTDLNEDYLSTFYAVQETLNDVLLSMEAGGNFEYTMGGA